MTENRYNSRLLYSAGEKRFVVVLEWCTVSSSIQSIVFQKKNGIWGIVKTQIKATLFSGTAKLLGLLPIYR